MMTQQQFDNLASLRSAVVDDPSSRDAIVAAADAHVAAIAALVAEIPALLQSHVEAVRETPLTTGQVIKLKGRVVAQFPRLLDGSALDVRSCIGDFLP